MNLSCILILTMIINIVRSRTVNYCSKHLCKFQGGVNIGCNHCGSFDISCPLNSQLNNVTKSNFDTIVHLHNRYRSDPAQGKQSGFNTAERMPTLKWNTELANLTAMHVKRCSINHYQCHNTEDIVFSGQNIGSLSNNVRFINVTFFLLTLESLNGLMSIHKLIKPTQMNVSDRIAGHFTQMICDRVTEVGCAVAKYTQHLWNTINYLHLFVCKYSWL